MKKVNTTTIQTPSININYSANGVELKIQGAKIDCPAIDVASVTRSYYDGLNRSIEDSFKRMGIDITKIGSMFNQLLNFGDENLSKLVKVASEGVDELLGEGNDSDDDSETASGFYGKYYCSKPRVRLLFDRHLDSRLIPVTKRWYGIDFEYIFEAEQFLQDVSEKIGAIEVTTPAAEANLPLIERGVIRVDPKNKIHDRTILWRLEEIR